MTNRNDPDFLSTLRDRLLDSEQADKYFLNPGTIVGDEYVVEDKIAEGGSGYVYRCHRRSEPSSIYALKVTYPKSANAARRFQAEVNASYEVKHINVLRSIDCIFHGSALAYVMEYAPGGDLRDILDREQEIKVPAFLIIAKQLVAGLSAIHRKNIVHRDIKPENILFSKEGHLKIADFGISFSTELSRVTANGSLVGTINYMAPEYVRRGVFDERSDLFSLGIMLYELLTQQMPYGYAKSLEELVRKISNPPIAVSEIRSEVPYRLSNLLAKLLSPDPDERYQSAEEVGMDLMQIEEEMILKELPDITENYLQASELASLYEEKTIDWFHFLYFVFLSIITTSLLLLVMKITGI
jgi:serine/threonine protein kinase